MAEDQGPKDEVSGAEPEPQPEIPKEPQSLEAKVELPGQPPTKVSLTPVSVGPEGKEATVKVTLPEEGAKPEEGTAAGLLLLAAAAGAILLLSSRRPPVQPSG